MHTLFEIKDAILIAGLKGEIDHHVTAKLRDDIDSTMKMYYATDLIFDFSDVTFMDSSGVGMVLGRYKKIHQEGGHVVICACSFHIRRILYMSGIFSLMEYSISKDMALKLVEEHIRKEASGI